MMCTRLVNSNLPCHYKSCFETTAQNQLLDISCSQPGTCGDYAIKSRSMSPFASSATKKRNASHSKNQKGNGFCCDDERCKDQNHGFKTLINKGSGNEAGDCQLSMFDVFLKLSSKDKEFGYGRGFGCWNVCPQGHANSVLHNLKDPPRELVVYHKPVSASIHKQRNITSASGRLLEVRSTISTVTKSKTCKSAKSNSRPASTVEEKESNIWTESPQAIPIDYKFKHSRHAKQHADTYRESYTYAKMREKHHMRNLSGITIPRARLVCVNAQESGFRGMALGGKSASTTTTSDFDYYVPEACKKGGMKWYMCQRLRDNCDPKLSVNNPSPTEIAMLCKVPAVRRSSPSIPSNTNGKYGGKGTDKPYPFQLNISAENQTVRAPVKRPVRPVVTQ